MDSSFRLLAPVRYARRGRHSPPALLARARRAMRLYDLEGWQRAVPLLLEALESDAGSAEAYARLAECCAFWGHRREIEGDPGADFHRLAHQAAEQALALGTKAAEPHRAMARALARGPRADHRARLREARAAVELDPRSAENWYELWRSRGCDPAGPELRRALTLDRALVGAHIDLGAAHCGAGRLREAAAAFLTALRYNTRNSLAYYDLAMTLVRAGEAERARQTLRAGLQHQPGNALLLRADRCLEGGDHGTHR